MTALSLSGHPIDLLDALVRKPTRRFVRHASQHACCRYSQPLKKSYSAALPLRRHVSFTINQPAEKVRLTRQDSASANARKESGAKMIGLRLR